MNVPLTVAGLAVALTACASPAPSVTPIALAPVPDVPSTVAQIEGIPCLSREAMLAVLKRSHGETLAGWRIDERGLLLEILISDEGSWSVIETPPNKKRSCLIDAGQGARAPDVGVPL